MGPKSHADATLSRRADKLLGIGERRYRATSGVARGCERLQLRRNAGRQVDLRRGSPRSRGGEVTTANRQAPKLSQDPGVQILDGAPPASVSISEFKRLTNDAGSSS